MANIILPKGFNLDFSNPRVQPTGDVEIDGDHPLARDIKGVFLPTSTGWFDVINQQDGVSGTTGTPVSEFGKVGGGQRYTTAQRTALTLTSDEMGGTGETVLYIHEHTDTTDRNNETMGLDTSSNDGSLNAYFPDGAGDVFFYYGGFGAANEIIWTGYPEKEVGRIEYWVVRGGARGGAIYYNGQNVAEETTPITRVAASGNNFNINRGLIANGDAQIAHYLVVWGRELTDAEITEVSYNPYSFLKPKTPEQYFVPSADGVITSSGALAAQAATMSGTAEIVKAASGALVAQAATMSGTAEVEKTSSGSLLAQAATMNGLADITKTSSGALQAQSATMAGVANILQTITANGVLQAQPATMSGLANLGALVASGILKAQPATMSGTATTVPDFIDGTGALILGFNGQYFSSKIG